MSPSPGDLTKSCAEAAQIRCEKREGDRDPCLREPLGNVRLVVDVSQREERRQTDGERTQEQRSRGPGSSRGKSHGSRRRCGSPLETEWTAASCVAYPAARGCPPLCCRSRIATRPCGEPPPSARATAACQRPLPTTDRSTGLPRPRQPPGQARALLFRRPRASSQPTGRAEVVSATRATPPCYLPRDWIANRFSPAN
jgi:hypothetical protein